MIPWFLLFSIKQLNQALCAWECQIRNLNGVFVSSQHVLYKVHGHGNLTIENNDVQMKFMMKRELLNVKWRTTAHSQKRLRSPDRIANIVV